MQNPTLLAVSEQAGTYPQWKNEAFQALISGNRDMLKDGFSLEE